MANIGIDPKNPTTEVVRSMLPASGYTGTLLSTWINIKIPFNTTSTATANMAWINPEAGTVLARAFFVWRTAGTGTFIAGVSSDGTGSNNNIIAAGGITTGIVTRVNQPGSALTGTIGEHGGYYVIGPGGTGTNNSIVAQVTDTTTSTAVGDMIIQYTRLV